MAAGDWMLGPLGSLQVLTDPESYEAPLNLPAVVHQIAGRGGFVVDHPAAAKSHFALGWETLTMAEVGLLKSIALGAFGPGPFVFLDPFQVNLLSANQSTGTDALMDATGFVAITGTLSSTTAQADQGSRSLAWAVTAANQRMMQGDLANTTNATLLTDTPVQPSISYTGQVRGRLSTSTGTARLDIYWFTAAGAFISASTGSATALSNASFTSFTCTATAPATAALARLSVINTVMGAAQTIYLDKWQTEQAAAASTWQVGTGVPRVSFDADIPQAFPFDARVNTSLSLQEV